MAKGVYKISGNTTPTVLEKSTYKVEEWYPETPYPERNPHKVTWELFVEKNGKFKSTNIKKKGIGDFTFGKNAYKYTYKIEGYLYAPEGKEPMALVIKPQKNDKTSPTKEKDILGIRLTYQDGSKITKTLNYLDRLMATAKCQNLEKEYIVFKLWEDDTTGNGHHKKNEYITKSPPILVDSRGYARWNFSLAKTFISLAQKRESEDKKHEYYVTAEYNGRILEDSKNVNVANPEPRITITPKPSSNRAKPKATPNTPKPKPRSDSAKGSTHQGSKNNQPDNKGIITSVKLTDLKGQFFKKRPKFGEKIQLVIEGTNIKGKSYILKIWEDDITGKNDLLYNKEHKFGSDKQVVLIELTQEMQNTGEIGNNPKDPDWGEYWTRNYQEIFAEIILNNKTAQSPIIYVAQKTEAKKPENTKSSAQVGNTEKMEENNCGGKFCIKKGDKNELIREVNIRLAGFGGNVPTDKFTERTEKMIKQFQRDYMKVPETGKICGNVLKAIDEFSNKWTENISNYFCLCKNEQAIKNKCSGFGKGQFKGEYSKKEHTEKYHKYERPGIHRSLLWGVSALKYYLSIQKMYKYYGITAGYRCWEHNKLKGRTTTNHMGKAVDLQFSKNGKAITGKSESNISLLKEIRDNFFTKYLNTKYNWVNGKDNFCLEPFGLGSGETWSWIHMDVREFENVYLDDKFFTKTQDKIIGKNIVQLAIELGFQNTCNCLKGYESPNKPKEEKATLRNCEDKFSKVAPIILKHEGGYVNHKSDKGGATNKGITFATWKRYAKEDLNIEPTLDNLKKITDEQATKIYRKRYWEPKGFCKIEDERVGLMIYDWTITSGGAVKQVQKLLVNEFDQKITIDGGMGSLTIDAINNVENQDKLLNRLAEIRKQYYTNLTYTNGKKNDQEVFLRGWLNRVDNCLKFKP